jgi:hypothetical protein
MATKLTGKKVRKPSLSLRVRRGFEAIASHYAPQTEDEFAAVAWMRRTVAVLSSRQRQPQEAEAYSSPVATRSGGDESPPRARRIEQTPLPHGAADRSMG